MTFDLFEYTIKHSNFLDGGKKIVYSPLNREAFADQFLEIFEEQHYEKGRIKKDMTVIDLGANMGLASLYFKDYAKKIYAIEPSPPHFKALEKNTSAYSQIERFNFALSCAPGKRLLLLNDEGNIPESFDGNSQEGVPVDCVTIDKFFDDNKIEHVDLLKIDIEGEEYPIFQDSSFGRIASKIDYIIGESHINENYHPHFLPPILDEYGFKVELLPYKNLTRELTFTYPDKHKKTYKVQEQTIFFAYK